MFLLHDKSSERSSLNFTAFIVPNKLSPTSSLFYLLVSHKLLLIFSSCILAGCTSVESQESFTIAGTSQNAASNCNIGVKMGISYLEHPHKSVGVQEEVTL